MSEKSTSGKGKLEKYKTIRAHNSIPGSFHNGQVVYFENV